MVKVFHCDLGGYGCPGVHVNQSNGVFAGADLVEIGERI